MPHIFDNIENKLLDALQNDLREAKRADFCVGYFNLRGWRYLDALMEQWQGGAESCCRLLVGMTERPEDEMRKTLSLRGEQEIDQATVTRLKQRMAQEFREQLLVGAPSNADQQGLRRLSEQLRSKRLVVKLFLRHKLHAKLYLLHLNDRRVPIVGYIGSSNLTMAGLKSQGELNVDVLDNDACEKLERWFNDRWADRWCLDISQELADIIDESWAREEMPPPYYIYLKMAYHLSQEARAGLQDFTIPRVFRDKLFDYQVAAVKIAAHHLNKRGGVLIGDVVGLGKTLMATALARIMQDDFGMETLVICPKNLVRMWQDYMHEYGLVSKVLSVTNVQNEMPDLRRFRLLIIDESHNLRNREGKRYKAIKDYIEKNESKCILLSATPYNKSYLDLSAQLRLFLTDEQSRDMGIRPERLLSEMGETRFNAVYQCPVRSLTAFEQSMYADDWRELMRLYLVRRTRSFIQENYAQTDPATKRKYLVFSDGSRSYFPVRQPRTVAFQINEGQADDPYARLYADDVIAAINSLNLPRYGLANYIVTSPRPKPTAAEEKQLKSLGRAGRRLMGFCRTNLFKRLESGGPAFLESIERHILRNFVYLHAIENGLDLPLGTQDANLLDTDVSDEDEEALIAEIEDESGDITSEVMGETGRDSEARQVVELPGRRPAPPLPTTGRNNVDVVSRGGAGLRPGNSTDNQPDVPLRSEADFRKRAAEVYAQYAGPYKRRFKWLRPSLMNKQLARDLLSDARSLLTVLTKCGTWDANEDAKLNALVDLLTQQHPDEKVLIFTQFADTVRYLTEQLKKRGIQALEGVTGDSEDPTALAWRFSPVSNEKRDRVKPEDELRVLVATDVLSEGQNLQDCSIVVNYDLPWAIIRLIQRAGRVDRIGQKSDTIACYSFLPAEGVERLIRLRERVRERLQQNAEVVGTDEAFFEDELTASTLIDLYNEKAGILDGEADTEVDLASQAYQIWKNAIDANPKLKGIIERLPNVIFSTRAHHPSINAPEGVLLYMRTSEGNDALAWVNRKGEQVTQSQLAILRAAACTIDTRAIARPPEQHDLVAEGVKHILEEDVTNSGGQLGGASGARRKTYDRLKHYIDRAKDTLFPPPPELYNAFEELYRYPLQETARDTLNRQLRSGIDDEHLVDLVLGLYADNHLCQVHEQTEQEEPQIICSLGLFEAAQYDFLLYRNIRSKTIDSHGQA